MPAPLLTTKLYIPPPGKYLVERPRLEEKLNESLEPGCRLALISAPAGFGKTTLVAAWLTAKEKAASSLSAAWFSIDEGDNDPVSFWVYFIAALQTRQAGIGQQALSLITPQPQDLEGCLAALVNDLARLELDWVVILDDYHLVRNPVIHRSLAFLLEHVPPRFHLVLLSRVDPPLPLALMRGRGQLVEIRLTDLRFSGEDAFSYLNTEFGLGLETQLVQSLNQKTEGWIAGLQMAALSLREMAGAQNREKIADFIVSFSGSNRYILDYLLEEVLNRQPQAIQDFLMRTAILDALCGPLCDALLNDGTNAQAVLEALESSNLFIVPLDNQRCWYRYHHLFADLLRKRLLQTAPEIAPDLHRRAMQWDEQNGRIASAVGHAFQIQDLPRAAGLVAQIAEEMWGRGEYTTLLGWMNALPEEEKRRYPHLFVFQVSMLISLGKLQEAEACIPVLENHIRALMESSTSPSDASLLGDAFALRTYIASFYKDWPALFQHARAALENLPRAADAGQRCGVLLVLGNACLVEGRLEDADQALVDAMAEGKKAGKPHLALSAVANLVNVLCLRGNLTRAAQVCQEGFQLVQQNEQQRSVMAVNLWIGWGEIQCERFALVEAETAVNRGIELAQQQRYLWSLAWGYQVLARLLLAKGDFAAAESAVQAVEQLANLHELPEPVLCRTRGLKVEVWLHQGKLAQAEAYRRASSLATAERIEFPHLEEYLAFARLDRLQGKGEAAADLLRRIQQWAEVNHHPGGMVSALVQQAVLDPLKSDIHRLERAMTIARSEDRVLPFVEEGGPMAALLQEALRQNVQTEFAERLLSFFPDAEANAPEKDNEQAWASEKRPGIQASLPEPLSKREMEVLHLISEGYSNKEIAQKLYLSLRTVKYYSTSLYNKLGVDGRMLAVIRARELNLL